jgi:hypothetical protein
MAQIIALTTVIVICCLLFRREIGIRDLNPLVVILLVLTLVMLTYNGGNTIALGATLWKSYWLPQMLCVVIIFLLIILPGPKLMTIVKELREKGPAAYQALTTAVIGVLVCVLLGLITMTVSSRLPFL